MLWTGLNMDMLDQDDKVCHLEVMKILLQKNGFEEVRKLAQYWKPRPRFTCINMVLKSKLTP